jgi:hypothetical protein
MRRRGPTGRGLDERAEPADHVGMVAFVACPACSCHVKPAETECPHCGERLRRPDGSLPRTAAAILLGLSAAAMPVSMGMGGCSSETEDDGRSSADSTDQSGAAAPAYGVPETSSESSATGTGGNGGDGGGGVGGAGGLGGAGDGGAGGVGGKGAGGQGGGIAPAYGLPETTSGGS